MAPRPQLDFLWMCNRHTKEKYIHYSHRKIHVRWLHHVRKCKTWFSAVELGNNLFLSFCISKGPSVIILPIQYLNSSTRDNYLPGPLFTRSKLHQVSKIKRTFSKLRWIDKLAVPLSGLFISLADLIQVLFQNQWQGCSFK